MEDVPPRRHHRFRRQLAPNVELQTPRHPVHPDVPRAPAAQVNNQADIGGGQKRQNQDIREVHALI
jgi:hypothetical protein